MGKKRILIGITTAETVCFQTMESIHNLIIPENTETVLRIIHSYNVADGRNDLVNIMFAENFDYIFFVDNDVVLPKNALVDLYNMQWYFSVGTYPRKIKETLYDPDPYTTLYLHNEENKAVYCPHFMRFSYLQKGKITQVDCCGLGCALISKDLFEQIEQPWFFFAKEAVDGQKEYCLGEDMWFCRKVIKSGFQIWAHGDVLCGHLGTYIFGFPPRKEEPES